MKRMFLLGVLLTALLASFSGMALAQNGDDDPDDFPVFMTVTGEVQEIEDDVIVVDEIEVAPGRAFRPNQLDVGDIVEVSGVLTNDGVLLAEEFELITPVEDRDDLDSLSDADAADGGNDDDDGPGNGRGQGNNDDDDDDGPGRGRGQGNDDDEEDDDGPGRGGGQGNNGNNGQDNQGRDNDPQNDNDPAVCDRDAQEHPVLDLLSDEFEVAVDTLIDWRCEGFGIGDIARALIIEDETGTDAGTILASFEDNRAWGRLLQDLGINPGELASGRRINRGRNGDDNPGQGRGPQN